VSGFWIIIVPVIYSIGENFYLKFVAFVYRMRSGVERFLKRVFAWQSEQAHFNLFSMFTIISKCHP
jgi:hypothetical protein